MKTSAALLAVATVLVLGGCADTTMLRNTANTECGRRVHSDRERCLRNNESSDQALAARKESGRASKDAWVTQTLERIDPEAGN
jgi:hypothetical protein